MLKYNQSPPNYNDIFIPNWIHTITREQAEIKIKHYINTNNIGIYLDGLFLIRKKDDYGWYVISVYNYIGNEITHYLMYHQNDYFSINNLIIYEPDINKIIDHLSTNIEIGYHINNKIKPLCRFYLYPNNNAYLKIPKLKLKII